MPSPSSRQSGIAENNISRKTEENDNDLRSAMFTTMHVYAKLVLPQEQLTNKNPGKLSGIKIILENHIAIQIHSV